MKIKSTKKSIEFLAGDHTYIKELLHPEKDGVDISYSMAHARLPVGETSLPHRLKSSEIYYILQGKGKAFIEEKNAILEVGDTLFIPANALQYVENVGDVDLLFLCVVCPEWRAEEEYVGSEAAVF